MFDAVLSQSKTTFAVDSKCRKNIYIYMFLYSISVIYMFIYLNLLLLGFHMFKNIRRTYKINNFYLFSRYIFLVFIVISIYDLRLINIFSCSTVYSKFYGTSCLQQIIRMRWSWFFQFCFSFVIFRLQIADFNGWGEWEKDARLRHNELLLSIAVNALSFRKVMEVTQCQSR